MTQFVVALHAEAKPLIDHYRLEPTDERAFRTFEGHGHRLVISGIGKVAAAAATAFTYDGPLDVWVNVGIAGHRERAPGHLVRATCVRDASTGTCYYPTSVAPSEIEPASVTTVDAPETAFESNEVFDMEASGFMATALRFSTAELVHCVKIVSDNLDSGTDALTGKRVGELIENNLERVTTFATELETLSTELEPLRFVPDLEPFLRSWHFTATQRRRLSRLFIRHRAFEQLPSVDDFQASSSASAVLDELSRNLATLASERQSF